MLPWRPAAAVLAVVLLFPAGAAGDPVEGGAGRYRTATWDFATPADYLLTGVDVAGGNATLSRRASQLAWTLPGDFAGNASQAMNLSYTGGGFSLLGDPNNLVMDGGFVTGAPWTATPAGNVGASASPPEGRLNASAGRLPDAFNGMNSLAGWVEQGSGTAFTLNTTDFIEPTASITVSWQPFSPFDYGGARRGAGGPWDVSAYAGFRAWTNTSEVGAQVRLRLDDTVFATWSSPPQAVGNSWELHEFDFAGATVDLSSILFVEFQFTNLPAGNPSANLDDLTLYYSVQFDETATVAQTVTKTRPTEARPGEVRLSFDLAAMAAENATADLVVTLGAFTATLPLAGPLANTTVLDPSLDVPAAGPLDLTFALRVQASTTGLVTVDVRVDNVDLRAPGYANGSYLSNAIDLFTNVTFGTLASNATLGGGQASTVLVRSGPSAVPDASWSGWIAHGIGTAPSGLPAGRYVQMQVLLNTSNGFTTPTFDDVTLGFTWYAATGSARTLAYLPSAVVTRWDNLTWNATVPPGTAADLLFSTDGIAFSPAVAGLIDAPGTPGLWLRFDLSTADTTVTPVLHDVTLAFDTLGPLAVIEVSPPTWSGTADGTVTFTAAGRDAAGNPVPFTANWSTDDPSGTIDANGTYSPGSAGVWTVYASNGTGPVLGTASVTVSPGALFWINLLPPSGTVRVGQTLDFDAYGTDYDLNPVAVSPSWSTDDPGGTVSSTGLFTPCVSGDWFVRAQQGVVWQLAAVNVTPGPPTALVVSPASATITADETVAFTATGTDACGNANTTFAPSWGTSDSAGTIDASGRYFPGAPGTHTITVGSGTVTAAAVVNVTAGNATRIAVSPSGTVFMTADDTQAFSATGYDRFDTPFPFSPVWSEDDPHPNGTIGTDGVYAAAAAGFHTVTARSANGTLTDSTEVFVAPGRPARLRLSPAAGTHAPGAMVDFLLGGWDADDNPTPLTSTLWSWAPPVPLCGSCSQTADALRLQLPATPGAFIVTATHTALTASATLTIAASGLSISGPAPLTLLEDSGTYEWDLSAAASGDVASNLTWEVDAADPALAGLATGGFGDLVVRVTPRRDAAGQTAVTLTLRSRSGAAVTASTTLTVTAVNDAPRFDAPPSCCVQAGTPYPFDLSPYIRDVDDLDEDLVLTTTDPDHASVNGLSVTFVYDLSYLGRTVAVGLNVTDGDAWATQAILLNVTEHRPPQRLLTLPPITFAEDGGLSDAFPGIDLDALFSDDSALEINASASAVRPRLFSSGGRLLLNLTAPPDWFGTDVLIVRATDATGCIAEASAVIVVTPVNDAPTIDLPFTTLRVRFNESHSVDLAGRIADVDDAFDELALTTDDARAWFQGPVLTLLFPQYTLGVGPWFEVPVNLAVSDGDLQATVRLIVNVSNQNPPRLVVPFEDLYLEEDGPGATLVLSGNFDDAEDGPLGLDYKVTVTAVTGPEFDPDYRPDVEPVPGQVRLTLAFPGEWSGAARVTVTATDTSGAFAIATFTAHVEPVDDPPTLDPLPDTVVQAGTYAFLDLRVFVTDPDSDLGGLTVHTSSPYLSAYGLVLLLEYPPGAPPTDDVTITLSDESGASAQGTLHVTIDAVVSPAVAASPLVFLGLAALVAFVLAAFLLLRSPPFRDAFLISRRGRLIAHRTLRRRADKDESEYEILLAAVNEFATGIPEGEAWPFEEDGRHLLVARRALATVAVVPARAGSKAGADSLDAFLSDVEERYGVLLRQWAGNVEELPGIGAMVEAFLRARRYRRGAWDTEDRGDTE